MDREMWRAVRNINTAQQLHSGCTPTYWKMWQSGKLFCELKNILFFPSCLRLSLLGAGNFNRNYSIIPLFFIYAYLQTNDFIDDNLTNVVAVKCRCSASSIVGLSCTAFLKILLLLLAWSFLMWMRSLSGWHGCVNVLCRLLVRTVSNSSGVFILGFSDVGNTICAYTYSTDAF